MKRPSQQQEKAVEDFKEEELIALVRDTVVQLNILGDRLERYAESKMPQKGEEK